MISINSFDKFVAKQEGASVSQIPTKSPIKSSLASPNRSPDLKSPPKKVAFITEVFAYKENGQMYNEFISGLFLN